MSIFTLSYIFSLNYPFKYTNLNIDFSLIKIICEVILILSLFLILKTFCGNMYIKVSRNQN